MSGIYEIITAVPISFLAAFFAFRFAFKDFLQKKSWERRVQAYEEIVAALYDVVQYCSIQKEDYGQGTGLSSQRETQLLQEYLEARRAIKKATDIGLLYVSEPVYKTLLELSKKPMLNPEHEPWFEVYTEEYEKHEKALKDIIQIATKDLNLDEKSLFQRFATRFKFSCKNTP